MRGIIPSRLRVLALGVLAAGIYANAIHGAPVFDDISSIILNPTIRPPLRPLEVLSPPLDTTVAGRPIANASFAIDFALFGPSFVALHVTNILIHLAAAVLLMLLVEQTLLLPRFGGKFTTRAVWLSFAIAVLWLVHPLQTESVTYLSQRVESLAGFFLLLTLFASLRAHLSSRPFAWSAVAIFACGLGMASKESMATAPVLVVLFDRAFLFGRFREAFRVNAARKRLYGSLAATWGVLLLLAMTNPRGLSTGLHFFGLSPWSYLKIQCMAIAYGLVLAFDPTNLVFDYGEAGLPGVPFPQHFSDWLPPALMLAFLLLASLMAWRRWPGLGFLGVSFFLLLAPSSSVIPIQTEGMAEHRFYLPLAALIGLVVLGVDQVIDGGKWRHVVASLATAMAVLVCAQLTVARNAVYATPLKLWQDTVEKWPANPRALGSLGMALDGVHDELGAENAFERALVIEPRDFLSHYHLGRLRERRGDCADALEHYAVAVGYFEEGGLLEFHRANCLVELDRASEAIPLYRQALAIKPRDGEFETHLALAMARLGQIDEALQEHRLALSHWPDWAEGHALYAQTLLSAGQPSEAQTEVERALTLEPELGTAHLVAAHLAVRLDRFAEARTQLETASHDANAALTAEEELAWLLVASPDPKVRDPVKAAEWAERAAVLGHGRRRWRAMGIQAVALSEARKETARALAGEALRISRPITRAAEDPFHALVSGVAQGEAVPEPIAFTLLAAAPE